MKKGILIFTFFLIFNLVFSYAQEVKVEGRARGCGDGVCDFEETCSNCPQDCGVCPVSTPPGGGGPGIYIPNISVSPYSFSFSLKNLSSFIPLYVEIPFEKNLSIVAIILETTKNLAELNLTVERIFEKPPYITSPSDNEYIYLNITSSSSDIFRVKFKFKIEKSWFRDNRISNISQIAMFRFKGNWERLSTLLIYEDPEYYYYYSECFGLSLFLIGSYREEITIPYCPLCPKDTEWTVCVNNEQSKIRYICGNETSYQCLPIVEKRACEVARAFDFTFVYLAVIFVLVVTLAGIFFRRKITFKPIKLLKPKPKEIKPKIIKGEEVPEEEIPKPVEIKPEEEKLEKIREVPKVEIKPEVQKKIKVKKIEDIVNKLNVGDFIRVKADVALHAIGIPNIYKLEDDSAVIYGSYDKLIDRGAYWVEAIIKEEDGIKYLEIKEVKNV
ncbi:MAG: PGF-pre-PGF domain-containing protein [Candidatus Aenigmatarchaeota archaeon]